MKNSKRGCDMSHPRFIFNHIITEQRERQSS